MQPLATCNYLKSLSPMAVATPCIRVTCLKTFLMQGVATSCIGVLWPLEIYPKGCRTAVQATVMALNKFTISTCDVILTSYIVSDQVALTEHKNWHMTYSHIFIQQCLHTCT